MFPIWQKKVAHIPSLWYKKSALARTIKKLVVSSLQNQYSPSDNLSSLGILFLESQS
jgi:hypothetical protein